MACTMVALLDLDAAGEPTGHVELRCTGECPERQGPCTFKEERTERNNLLVYCNCEGARGEPRRCHLVVVFSREGGVEVGEACRGNCPEGQKCTRVERDTVRLVRSPSGRLRRIPVREVRCECRPG